MKRFKEYAGPFLLVLLFSLLAGELTLRIANRLRPIPALETIKYGRDLKSTLLHQPQKTETIMGQTLRTNSLGLRGPEVDSEKSARRVLVFGSSVALGWGVAEDQTFSSVIAQKFTDVLKQPIEGYNAGLANSNSKVHLQIMDQLLPVLQPDLLVLVYYLADVIPTPAAKRSKFSEVLSHSYLMSYLQIWISRLGFLGAGFATQAEYFDSFYQAESPEWISTQADIVSMDERAKYFGVPLMVILYPDTHDLSPKNPYVPIYQKVETFLKSKGIRYLEGIPEVLHSFQGKEKELWVTRDDPHGNSMLVNILVDLMISKKSYQLLDPTL